MDGSQRAQGVLYVDAGAQQGGNGDSWETAFIDLQDAIARARSLGTDGVEIRIAEGRYTPDSGTGDPLRRFEISDLDTWHLLGGFPAGGGTLDERSVEQYATVLSGDLLGDDVMDYTPMEFDEELHPLNLPFAGVKYQNRGDNALGVLYVHDVNDEVVIEGVVIEGGHANKEQNRSGGGLHAQAVRVTLCDVQIRENYAQIQGGGVFIEGPEAELHVEGSELRLNLSLSAGGAICSSSTTVDVIDSTVRENMSARGGGHFGERGVIEVRDSVYADNLALIEGGGFHGGAYGNASFSESVFNSNVSLAGGGGLYVSRPLTVMMCTFESNIATGRGGGMLINSESTISHSSFRMNTSLDSGGGASVHGDNVLSDCLFEQNTSLSDGGGLSMTNRTVLVDSIVRQNNARRFGGGVHAASSTEMRRVRVEQNSTEERGGGVFASSGAELIDMHFQQNEALIDGGGLYMSLDSRLSRSVFRQNMSEGSGGAIAMSHGNSVSLTIIDSNNAAVSGGGIYAYNTENIIEQVTCVHNEAPESGGVYSVNPIEIRDSLIWSNYAQTGTLEAGQIGGGSHTVIGTLVMGLDQYTGGGNIGEDPLFIDEFGQDQIEGTGDEDLRLSSASPAIDAGASTGIPSNLGPFDLDGSPRFVGFGGAEINAVDMGAYETQDCDADSMSDAESILFGLVQDCNDDGVPDVCQANSFTQSAHRRVGVTDAHGSQRFGDGLVLDDGLLAVSASRDDDQGLYAGAVYLYDAETDELLRKITSEDVTESDMFGSAMGMSQGVLAVGSIGDSTAGYRAGALFVFDTSTGAEIAKVIPENVGAYDNFGYGVAVGSGYIAVGSSRVPTNLTPNGGSVYVFDMQTRELLYQIVVEGLQRDDAIGQVLEIHDGLLYIGYERDGRDDYGAGSVLVYRLADGAFVRRFVPENISRFAYFGSSIDVHGTVLAVGAYGHDEHGQSAGAVYLFDRETGAQLWKLIPSDIGVGDRFGISVSIDDRVLIAGAINGGEGNGAVYMYDIESGELISKIVDPSGVYYEGYGAAVELADGKFYVGNQAWRADNEASGDVFAVYPSVADADHDGIPDSCLCEADFDGNGVIDFFDVSAFIVAFQSHDPRADFVIDGRFDFFDISKFIGSYLSGCSSEPGT